MKKLILIISLYAFTTPPEKVLLQKFSIDGFQYSIYKENKYLHDDDIDAEYYIVYKQGQKNSMCSSFMSAKEKDKVLTKGTYLVKNKELIFKEYYYDKAMSSSDSMIKLFTPDKKGILIMSKVTQFKNGKGEQVKF
nr:hypothetical protein [uncultured Flavobacterium sp.]